MTPIEQHTLICEKLEQFKATLKPDVCLPVDVRRMLDYIHEHLFEERLSIKTLLDALNIRSHNYSSRFQRAMLQCGRPPFSVRDYIEHHRISAALLLLQHDEVSVCQVAFSVGYAHYETFHRAFKRCVGYAPAQHNGRKARERPLRDGAAKFRVINGLRYYSQ